MSYCMTSMRLHAEGKIIETEELKMKRKIFQGNAIPPLLLCINIFALTELLNKLKSGYQEHPTKEKYHTCFTRII